MLPFKIMYSVKNLVENLAFFYVSEFSLVLWYGISNGSFMGINVQKKDVVYLTNHSYGLPIKA